MVVGSGESGERTAGRTGDKKGERAGKWLESTRRRRRPGAGARVPRGNAQPQPSLPPPAATFRRVACPLPRCPRCPAALLPRPRACLCPRVRLFVSQSDTGAPRWLGRARLVSARLVDRFPSCSVLPADPTLAEQVIR